MKTVTVAARTLFPVVTRPAPPKPRRAGSGGMNLLGSLLAVTFAATPFIVLIDAVAQTA